MMLTTTGSMLGAVFGLAHAIYVFGVVNANAEPTTMPGPVAGLYAATWTLALWILFGTYLLTLWLAACVLYLVFKVWFK